MLQRIQALAEELLGVLLSPVLLMLFLPDAAHNIVGVLASLQHTSPNLGDWCSYGCLDLSMTAENSGGAASSAEGCQATQLNRHMGANEKVEKSVLSFCLNHQLIWPSSDQTSDASWVPPVPPLQARAEARRPMSLALQSLRPQRPEFSQDIPLEEISQLSHVAEDGTGMAAPTHPLASIHTESEPLLDINDTHRDEHQHPHQDSADLDILPRTDHGSTTSPVTAQEEHVLTHIIGVPLAAINLLHDVQDFHEKETSEHPPSGENIALLPADLVSLPPLAPGRVGCPGMPALGTTVCRTGDEPDACLLVVLSCSL